MSSNYFHYPIEVRFRDLDALGHVNNAVFLTYLESARVRWCQSCNFIQKDIENFSIIQARTEVDYLLPVKFDTSIELKLWVSHIGTKSFTVSYLIENDQNQYLKAKTVLVWFDYSTQKSIPIPQNHKTTLQNYFTSKEN